MGDSLMSTKGKHLFTSESVTEGHPDKVADQISDAILDAIMKEDPQGRVACESLVTTGLAFVAGEITTSCYIDIPKVIRNTIKEIGYTRAKYGFDYKTCAVITSIKEQSGDIALGVDKGGAGDQGLMFGYACRESEELMPIPIILAHKLAMRLSEVRRKSIIDYLRPDGKTQVTIEYDADIPKRIDNIIISAQHSEAIPSGKIKEDIIEEVIKPIIAPEMLDDKTVFRVNPTGRFVVGGPMGDCGVTGRKIIVDTYGGVGSHGGGCFSGKDPTKVDRSASYMARYIAKNLVAANIADKIEVQLAYAIGVAEPVSIYVDTFGTNNISEDKIKELIIEHFPLTPLRMIDYLKLRRPIYKKTAAYGHFGRSGEEFTWEKTDLADTLRSEANL
jgi:S-adenosylmethionine synthetase